MRALVCRQYGAVDRLRVEEVETPHPRDGEVLVKVRAAALNAGDWRLVRGDPFFLRLMGFGLLRPKNPIVGMDFAGIVEAVGSNVDPIRPGDAVYGCTAIGKALTEGGGAVAEYVCVPVHKLLPKPERLTFEQAAAVPEAALTALQAVRDGGKVSPGKKVLINGASGGVGTFAVQIAKALGAHVTGVCSTPNVDLVRSLGADEVVDYRRQDFADGRTRYDVILDAAAFRPFSALRRALEPAGTYVLVGGSTSRFLQTALLSPILARGKYKVVSFSVAESREDLAEVSELIDAGTVFPVIDRTVPLSHSAQALAYVEQGHARGKVVISV